jgi:hypothetical protein
LFLISAPATAQQNFGMEYMIDTEEFHSFSHVSQLAAKPMDPEL